MHALRAFVGVVVVIGAVAACGADVPGATEAPDQGSGNDVAPVPADEGRAVDWRTGSASAASLLEPATIENAITVIGTGSVTVAPDEADVYLAVSVRRETVTEARDEAASLMSAVLEAVRSQGVADTDIQTVTLSLSPVYDYDDDFDSRGGYAVIGYQVDNGVRVRVRDLDRIATLIDDAMGAGATGLDGISFVVSDPSIAEAEARADAVADARRRAEALATAADVELGAVMAIGETQSSPVWPYAYGRSAADMGGTSIEPGTSEVSVSVQVVFRIR
jgi:uncharacterized protein YggE